MSFQYESGLKSIVGYFEQESWRVTTILASVACDFLQDFCTFAMFEKSMFYSSRLYWMPSLSLSVANGMNTMRLCCLKSAPSSYLVS